MKINKILVPVDFSENSINALRYAAAFAKGSEAVMVVMHVSDNETLDDELRGNLAPDHLFELLKKEPWMSGIKMNSMIVEGGVEEAVLENSMNLDVDLIVMGTQGASTMARTLVGTNTTKVVGKSRCAVLVVPAEATFTPVRKVILAVDLDHRTDHLVKDIVEMLKVIGASVLLVYVGKDPSGKLERELIQLTDDLKKSTGYEKIVSKLIPSGEFPMSLESYAFDIEADIITMITHHRGVFESIFDPSETKLYTYHTSMPLLVVPHHRKPVFFL